MFAQSTLAEEKCEHTDTNTQINKWKTQANASNSQTCAYLEHYFA